METLYRWRRQALTDAGQRPGTKSLEADPLAQARRRGPITSSSKIVGHPALHAKASEFRLVWSHHRWRRLVPASPPGLSTVRTET